MKVATVIYLLLTIALLVFRPFNETSNELLLLLLIVLLAAFRRFDQKAKDDR
ncbi:MAG TPA: hypothetical protein H9869_08670 [Candidatus Ligilactobacillus excrementipullorum]|nr:hypothetical protein [Candidatus Ligilactobacillus excrementipullorum]